MLRLVAPKVWSVSNYTQQVVASGCMNPQQCWHLQDLPRHTPWACVTRLSTFFSRSHARTFDSHASGSQTCFFLSNSLFSFVYKLFKKYEYRQSQSRIYVLWPYELSVPGSFLAQPVPFCFLLRLNGHLNLKWGHSLDSTCPYLAPNRRKSPFLGVKFFKIFQSSISPDPGSRSRGTGGPCPPFRIFFLFFTETKLTRKKNSIKHAHSNSSILASLHVLAFVFNPYLSDCMEF